MASDLMLALGDYRFSVSTAAYQQLRRSSEYRWQAQERVGRSPAQQFSGAGGDEITVTGVIYTHYQGGLDQLDAMRSEAALGKPLLLIDGVGWVHDLWIIKRIEETKSVFFSDGTPRKIEFTMSIAFYGEDA